jgi:DNA-binding response OmpR family regulator
VTEAPDGEEGVRAAHERAADLVVTDIIMPDKEGLATIMELRREFPDTKIIAMSAGGARFTIDFLPMAKALGAHETLTKPFMPQDLLAAVERLLR